MEQVLNVSFSYEAFHSECTSFLHHKERREAQTVLVAKSEGKRPLEKAKRR
jgi:hypothetical protein